MRAVLCREICEPHALELAEIPAPTLAGPKSVRIAMRAASLNFADTLIVTGKYQDKAALPFVPGIEGAGVVLEVGADVTHVKPGDRVMASMNTGAFAQEAVAEAHNVFAIPDAMDFAAAASFQVVYGTSHLALARRGQLKPGETLLVLGAAGGVGLTAIELGKRMGATVIASARGAEKCALAASYGADHVLDSGTEDLKTRVREITKNRGVDMVYDPVGGDAFDVAVRLLAWEGRLMVVGFAAGRIPQAPANILLVKNAAVIGVLWGAYRNLAPGIVRASFEELLGWYAAGQLKPHISLRLPLARVEDGFAAMLTRRSTGKIVFDIG